MPCCAKGCNADTLRYCAACTMQVWPLQWLQPGICCIASAGCCVAACYCVAAQLWALAPHCMVILPVLQWFEATWPRYDPGPPPEEVWPTWRDAERALADEQWPQETWWSTDSDCQLATPAWDYLSDEPGTPGQHLLEFDIDPPQQQWYDDPEELEDWEQRDWEAWQPEVRLPGWSDGQPQVGAVCWAAQLRAVSTGRAQGAPVARQLPGSLRKIAA
jgi:hypothetical protein